MPPGARTDPGRKWRQSQPLVHAIPRHIPGARQFVWGTTGAVGGRRRTRHIAGKRGRRRRSGNRRWAGLGSSRCGTGLGGCRRFFRRSRHAGQCGRRRLRRHSRLSRRAGERQGQQFQDKKRADHTATKDEVGKGLLPSYGRGYHRFLWPERPPVWGIVSPSPCLVFSRVFSCWAASPPV